MKILVADDHPLMREVLKETLAKLPDVTTPITIYEAATVDQIMALAKDEVMPDVILLDLHMPGSSGVLTVETIVAKFPTSRVLCISGLSDPITARKCIDSGAAGFIPKTTSGQSLRNAIKVILDGEVYVHSYLLTNGDGGQPHSHIKADHVSHSTSLPIFSTREEQIVNALIAGKSNKEMARILDMKEMTVKTHLRNIYRKLGTQNRAGAVSKVLQNDQPRPSK
jgi:two-component system, NarL family, nitrate/nitrite response regulator NarL